MAAAKVFPPWLEYIRNDKLLRLKRQETRRQNADNGVTLIVEQHGASHHVPAGTETALPQLMREHDHLFLPRLVFVRRKNPAQHRARPQDVQAVCGHTQSVEPLGLARARKVQHDAVVGRETIKRCALLAPIEKHAGRNRILLAGTWRFEQLHELPRLLIRQRLQEHSIDNTEDRGVRTNAECQRQYGYSSEAWALQQLAESESEIIHDAAPPWDRLINLLESI